MCNYFRFAKFEGKPSVEYINYLLVLRYNTNKIDVISLANKATLDHYSRVFLRKSLRFGIFSGCASLCQSLLSSLIHMNN